MDARSDHFCGLARRLLAQVDGDYQRAGLRHGLRNAAPYTGACARDHGDTVLQEAVEGCILHIG
jgi:hypothetical protein